MEKNPSPESAFFNPRVLLGFALCFGGVLLVMLGFAATPQPTDRARQELRDGPMSALPSSVQTLLRQTLQVPRTESLAASISPAFVADGYHYDVLHQFGLPAALPWSGLIEGSDGNFYGTTVTGGLERRRSVQDNARRRCDDTPRLCR